MRHTYPLFHSHLDLAHGYWRQLLAPGDIAIDATCGNGNDTSFLAELLFQDLSATSQLIAIDKQPLALENTKRKLQESFGNEVLSRLHFYEQCHSQFPFHLEKESVKLIVYNLGYLPQSDKQLKTHTTTTLASLKAAITLIQTGGAISITCYPGHAGGDEEAQAVREFASALPDGEWSCYWHERLNRKKAPVLVLLQKRKDRAQGT